MPCNTIKKNVNNKWDATAYFFIISHVSVNILIELFNTNQEFLFEMWL